MRRLLRWGLLSVLLISACTTAQIPTNVPPSATDNETSPVTTPALTSPLESPIEGPPEDVSGEEIAAVLKSDVATELGVDPETLRLISVKFVRWADASLGCPQPGMVYAQVITPGWRMVFVDEAGREYDVRASERGDTFVICKQGSTSTPMPIEGEEGAQSAVDAAKRLVREREDLSGVSLSVEEIKSVQWRDSCLGCAGPDEMCAMVITPGYRIVLKAGDTVYEVHTNEDGSAARLCQGPGKEPITPSS